MNYFYHPLLDTSVHQFSFSPEESRHIVKVLRKRAGDQLHITNGKGYLFTAEIMEADPDRCMGRILDTRKMHQKMYHLHLAVAPTKKMDRFEWFLEKATEIGVNRITPIICERSERTKLPMERLQRVIQEAMKQSLRTYLPELDEPVSLPDFLKNGQPVLKFIAHCEDDEKMDLKRRVAADKDVVILIGPEGDFSRDEIEMAVDRGFIPVSLGESRLRTETAALVACTTVNLINNG
ncbi:16S rRNA (uracil(1498)-N(3))-methyltransferase [Robiginitalea sp. SC105]|uniref:16S rRNA (uracil(1498)-N(3))-methyltransferase n=1 Tax=Robiginitalea sp. SC105 TaxID=2762332 RepID=UPI00163B2D31|nr:16S rRNA (uracil(1498)-N(3))-methyltransferase [Robiginitalea sp. SC105]MBC2840295.1 16S rRNA (uracil(1498)-N(3))-methyltransferase [Robiginitalea sp. SC105]